MKVDDKREGGWELQPGDLPSAEAIAREPRLGGMEENPFFRLIVFRRRFDRFTLGDAWNASGSNVVMLILAVVFWFIALPILLLTLAVQRFAPPKQGISALLLRPHPMLAELVELGLTAEEAALGMWGASVCGARERREEIVFGLVVAATALVIGASWRAVMVMGIKQAEPMAMSAGAMAAAVAAFVSVARRGRPHHVLARLARLTQPLAKSVESKANARSVFSSFVAVVGLSVGVVGGGMLVALLFIGVGTFVSIAVEEIVRSFGRGFSARWIFIALLAASASAGATFGFIMSQSARENADRRLKAATEDLRRIFKWIDAIGEREAKRKGASR
jgi:hypothetical protein